MRRCVALLASTVLIGCGGSADRAVLEKQEEKDPAPAVALNEYLDALVAKDWRRACRLLAEQGITMRIWQEQGGCEKNMADGVPLYVAPNTRKAMDQGDYDLKVEDDTATVTPEGTGSYTLVREEGEWRVLEPS